MDRYNCVCVYGCVGVHTYIHIMYVCTFVCVFVYYIFVLFDWFSCAVGSEWYTRCSFFGEGIYTI